MAKNFTIAIAKNPALAAEAGKQLAGKSSDKAAQAFVALGKTNGFDFTAAEASEIRSQVVSELSEEDLDKVAGGAGSQDQAANSAAFATSQLIGAVSPVPLVGGVIGPAAGAAVGSAVSGGSGNDVGLAFISGPDTALSPVKDVMGAVFSGW
jgi:hypothetical protein